MVNFTNPNIIVTDSPGKEKYFKVIPFFEDLKILCRAGLNGFLDSDLTTQDYIRFLDYRQEEIKIKMNLDGSPLLVNGNRVHFIPEYEYPYCFPNMNKPYLTEDGEIIISRHNSFKEIRNLISYEGNMRDVTGLRTSSIILEDFIDVMSDSVEQRIGINPYYDFYIELIDEKKKDYDGYGLPVVVLRDREFDPKLCKLFVNGFINLNYYHNLRQSTRLQDKLNHYLNVLNNNL